MAGKSVNIGHVGSVKLDTSKLERVERELGRKYRTEVGILSAKNSRKEAGMTNAYLGLIHEKGSVSRKIPARSFLEMPLVLKMPRYLKQFGQQVMDSLDKDNIGTAYRNLGIKAEDVVDDAFASGGFGQWPKSKKIFAFRNKHPTAKKAQSPLTLVETGQLRRSIMHRVVEAA